MGYWDATARIIAENGGRNPICPVCNTEMYPIDDHGRFACKCKPLFSGGFLTIPQIREDANLTDEEKEKIPAINRLHLEPTESEKQKLAELDQMMKDAEKEMRKLQRKRSKKK